MSHIPHMNTSEFNEVYNALVAKLNADIASDNKGMKEHAIIKGIIAAKWNGKAINKRFCTHARAALSLPESAVVTLEYVAGMCYLAFWTTSHNDRTRYFLGYNRADSNGNSYDNLSPEYFEAHNQPTGDAAAKRNEKRQELLTAGKAGSLGQYALAIVEQREAAAKAKKIKDYFWTVLPSLAQADV